MGPARIDTARLMERCWIAHASRVLVSASRRSDLHADPSAPELPVCGLKKKEKVRDSETDSPARETRALRRRADSGWLDFAIRLHGLSALVMGVDAAQEWDAVEDMVLEPLPPEINRRCDE